MRRYNVLYINEDNLKTISWDNEEIIITDIPLKVYHYYKNRQN